MLIRSRFRMRVCGWPIRRAPRRWRRLRRCRPIPFTGEASARSQHRLQRPHPPLPDAQPSDCRRCLPGSAAARRLEGGNRFGAADVAGQLLLGLSRSTRPDKRNDGGDQLLGSYSRSNLEQQQIPFPIVVAGLRLSTASFRSSIHPSRPAAHPVPTSAWMFRDARMVLLVRRRVRAFLIRYPDRAGRVLEAMYPWPACNRRRAHAGHGAPSLGRSKGFEGWRICTPDDEERLRCVPGLAAIGSLP